MGIARGTGSRYVADFGKTRLVYVERQDKFMQAIVLEKLFKKWRRAWEFALIQVENADWENLWERWFGAAPEES